MWKVCLFKISAEYHTPKYVSIIGKYDRWINIVQTKNIYVLITLEDLHVHGCTWMFPVLLNSGIYTEANL